MRAPRTHYAKTPDGLSVAYQVIGDGPVDMLFVNSVWCVDVVWDEPSCARFLEQPREVRAGCDLRDAQLDDAEAGVPAR